MKLIYGVGINDSDHKISDCPFYSKWAGMLERCYSEAWYSKYPTYQNTQVEEKWKRFSCFESWMKNQNWENNDLDKDLLNFGENKIYSEEYCVFIPKWLNKFFNTRSLTRSEDDILGVHLVKEKISKPYRAHCRRLDSNKKHIGYFDSQLEAHKAWQQTKIQEINKAKEKYKECYNDIRVIQAMDYRIELISEDIRHCRLTNKL